MAGGRLSRCLGSLRSPLCIRLPPANGGVEVGDPAGGARCEGQPGKDRCLPDTVHHPRCPSVVWSPRSLEARRALLNRPEKVDADVDKHIWQRNNIKINGKRTGTETATKAASFGFVAPLLQEPRCTYTTLLYTATPTHPSPPPTRPLISTCYCVQTRTLPDN